MSSDMHLPFSTVIGFNPSNYTVKESERTLLVTVMVLEGYIPEGVNITVTVNSEEGSATGIACISHMHKLEECNNPSMQRDGKRYDRVG